jgi:DNA-binding transcriptional LysR family regulator
VTAGPVRVPPAGRLAELLASPAPLLDVTLDQLRTLLAVQESGSPLRAAALLGREHSSVRKQLDALNRTFQAACGEAVVVKQGRGQDYLFTPTGEMAAEIAAGMFGDWLTGITERRRRLGAVVTVATTEFTVEFLAQVWPVVEAEFTRREIELNIVHVRTRDFWTQLEAKNVDLVCGSVPTTSGPDPALDAYDVIEWQREDLALITNLPVRELPVTSVTQDRLPGIPLLAPSAGLIADFLRRWYGHDFRDQLHIVAEIDSIYYGLALLRSRLVHGALISTTAAAQAAVAGRLPGGPGLRLVPLTPGFRPPLQILAGIFARKGERALYHPEHPLNLLWDAFDAHAHTRTTST